jgi:hypothetical protein
VVIAVLLFVFGYHYDTKAKTEAATAVIEILMMGERTPETY